METTVWAHLVRIHIDREPLESPNPTTGEALYRLGHVADHRELFREVGGDRDVAEVVKLAYPVPPSGQCIEFTVTYRNGAPANPKGTLTEGHSVKVKNRMIFDVTPTDRS